MTGQTRTGLNVMAVLFASAALALSQVNTVSAPGAQAQGPASDKTQQVAPAASAGPGTINYVEGDASANGESISQSAVGTVALEAGGVIDTQEGYVEMLLTPGAFLRVGHNSEIRMLYAGLADTRLEVVRGAAEIEVDQMSWPSSCTGLCLRSRRPDCTALMPPSRAFAFWMERSR